jgi:hypothetical protein
LMVMGCVVSWAIDVPGAGTTRESGSLPAI